MKTPIIIKIFGGVVEDVIGNTVPVEVHEYDLVYPKGTQEVDENGNVFTKISYPPDDGKKATVVPDQRLNGNPNWSVSD